MLNLSDYDYQLPKELIALKPAEGRDSSRLFIYDTKTDTIRFDHFINLVNYLPQNSFLVMNNTKVLPARVSLIKQTGGKIKVLFLVNEKTASGVIRGMADRKLKVGDTVQFDDNHILKVVKQEEYFFTYSYDFGKEKLFDLLEQYGAMPIPPYIKNSPLSDFELKNSYQTIFAKEKGSAAAPTASLHFSEKVFESLDKKNIERLFITLHVGLGTFAPLTEKNLIEKKLHEEYVDISPRMLQSIDKSKQEGKKLVAVGTTVVRSLESLPNHKSQITNDKQISNFKTQISKPTSIFHQQVSSFQTVLFIQPGFQFQYVDALITNFHLPKSSLMMLVEAFLQFKKGRRHLVDLYKLAIEERFRFYSFGDSMLIL